MKGVVDRRAATTVGQLHCPKGEAKALTKKVVANPHPTPKSPQGASCGGPSVDEPVFRTTVVQFSLLFDGDEEKFAHLWAMRDSMHRQLNTAFSEWRRADKVQSKTNPDKETLDRGGVTAAVKALLVREKEYWAAQLPARLARVEKLRVDLGRAKSKGTAERLAELEKEMLGAQREVVKVRVRAEIGVPSSVYDSVVRFTQSRLAIYRKEEFRGTRAADSFTAGQPVRWRDGSWRFAQGDKRGTYTLGLELSTDGKKVQRGTFKVIPDGPAMHGYAKMMVDEEALAGGDVKLCDARVVYSEKKKQWFAGLTIRYRVQARPKVGTGVAALRRGMNSAFVLVFDNGRYETIDGGDVIHFKKKLAARGDSIRKHKDRLEAGGGSRGRGKARRETAIRKMHAGEDRFVDWRCKTWAANIVEMCKFRGVGTLLVAKMGKVDMFDGNEHVEAMLRNWPWAKSLDRIKQAAEKTGLTVKEVDCHYDARRCPNPINGGRCGHVHETRQNGTFTCEVCGFKRPSDMIVAMNTLIDAVGVEPIVKLNKHLDGVKKTLKKQFAEAANGQ